MSGQDPLQAFRIEAEDLLTGLEQALLDLAATPDDAALVDTAFRGLHTLKGSGAMFGFRNLAAFLHKFESAFDAVRAGRAPMTPALANAALAAKDHAAALIHANDHDENPAEGAAILEVLDATVGADPSPAPETAADDAPKAVAGWRIAFRLPEQAIAFGANPALMVAELAGLGPCSVQVGDDPSPVDPATVARERYGEVWTVVLEAGCAEGAIDEAFVFVRDDMEIAITPLGSDAEAGRDPADTPDEQAGAAPVQPPTALNDATPAQRAVPAAPSTMRVATDRLDTIIDHVGELVIAQARLTQLARESSDPALKALSEEIERLSGSLRDTTMGIRMMPIGSLFGRFRRLVHDLADEIGKPVTLITAGEETELDKTVIERLADPIVHLIRNAADHGIEDAETRRARGKPETGTLRLSAAHEGATVVISLSDDGGGFDTARIRERAERLGLIAPDAVMPDAAIWQMIFHAGFSTRAEVTALSGRGVGMDVVRETVEALRGTIELAATPGQGATVRLRLPLTLAIIDGLLVRVGAARYVLPLAAVEECVELSDHADAAATGRRFVNIRGRLLPYLSLRELFAEAEPPGRHQKIVVASAGDTRIGLVVDQVIGTNQTVIKQLSQLHSGLRIFSGATILGDGTAALILDVMQLLGFGQDLEARLTAARMGRAA